MVITPFTVLIALALLFAIISIPWPNHYVLAVSVILLAVAQFVPK